MKVTALIENTTPDQGLRCEHGLALCIVHRGWNCLLDAGASLQAHQGEFPAVDAQSLAERYPGLSQSVAQVFHSVDERVKNLEE